MSIKLKIKHATLVAEAKIIRIERNRMRARSRKCAENGYGDDAKKLSASAQALDDHRRGIVRRAARSTHLARCFLLGTPYWMVEGFLREDSKAPNWDVVEKMVKKYGSGDPRDLMQSFSEWTEAEAPSEYLEQQATLAAARRIARAQAKQEAFKKWLTTRNIPGTSD